MRAAVIATIAALPLLSIAQTIDRVKLTDSDLTCPQIYGEIDEMNRIVDVAKGDRDASATTAAGAGLTQQATGVAVHAAAMSGSLGAAVGLAQAAPLLGLFGSATKSMADAKEKDAAERLGEAKARKEHLTGLFVGKSCKLSDVKHQTAAETPKLN